MTQRERKLALAVGLLLAVMVCGYFFKSVYDSINVRNATLANLRLDKEKNDGEFQRGLRHAEKIQSYAERALPGDSEVARSLYKNWLTKLAADHGIQNASVDPQSPRKISDVYELHPFTLTGSGDLRQVTELLYEVYATDLLHRVARISLKPIREKRELDLALTLEVLSMPSAPERKDIHRDSTALVNGRTIDDFKTHILGRNLFGPANNPPQLRLDGSYTAYRGQSFEVVARADDPDKLDEVQFEADLANLPGAQFSRREGRLQWTPKENGEYEVTLVARDDGIPQREIRRDIKIKVTDPPDPPPPPKPSFTAAKLAFVTGITEVNGEPQVWITLRTEGRTLKLGLGDQFQIGEMQGRVTEISGTYAVIEAGGQQIQARLGQSLVQ